MIQSRAAHHRTPRIAARLAALIAILAAALVSTPFHAISAKAGSDSPGSVAVQIGSASDTVDLYADYVGSTPCSGSPGNDIDTLTAGPGGYVYVEPGYDIIQDDLNPVINSDGTVQLELDDENNSNCEPLTYDTTTGLPELGAADPVLEDDTIAETEAPVEIELLPVDPGTYSGTDPIVGTGASGSAGDLQVTNLNLTPYSADPDFVSDDGDVTMEILYMDTSGDWIDTDTTVDYYISTDSGPYDPVINQHVATDPSSGDVLADTPIVVQAAPVLSASETLGSDPETGSGETDDAGHPCIEQSTLDDVIGNDTYEFQGKITFNVFEQETDGTLIYLFNTPEYVGGSDDNILSETQLLDSSSDPIADADVGIRIEPTSSAGWSMGTPYPLVGTGTTDSSGFVDASIDLSPYETSDFESSNDMVTLDISTVSDGTETYQTSVSEYLGNDYDPVLESQILEDDGGSPITDTPVQIQAVPLSDDDTTDTPVTLGTGSTDDFGDVIASIDTSSISLNPAYTSDNFIARLSIQAWESGSWEEIEQIPYDVGGNQDPVLAMNDISTGDEGISVEVFAQPQSVGIVCDRGGCHSWPPPLLVGTGTTGPDGEIHAPVDMTQAEADGTEYINNDGTANLDVQYDANGDCDTTSDPDCDDTPDWEDAGVSPTEYFGYAYDAVLAQQTVVDADGNPISGESVVAEAMPQDGSDASPLTIGTGTTDANGHPQIAIDPTAIEGESDYQDQDTLGVNIHIEADSEGDLSEVHSLDASGGVQVGLDATAVVAAGGTSCNTSQSLSDYTAAMAEACGYAAIPADHTETLSDGEQDTYYYHGGAATVAVEPPSSFDPVDSDVNDYELALYGYSPRPSTSEPDAYAAWAADAEEWSHAPAPKFLAADVSSDQAEYSAPSCHYVSGGTTYSICWSGLVMPVQPSTGTGVDQSYLAYTEPAQGTSSCAGARTSVWTGIGGYTQPTINTAVLGQDGTDTGTNAIWYETISTEAAQKTPGASGSIYPGHVIPIGHSVGVATDLQLKHKRFAFKFWDYTAKKFYGTYYARLNNYMTFNRDTAEAIVERPTVTNPNGQSLVTPLAKFTTGTANVVNVSGVQVNKQTLSQSSSSWYVLHMQSPIRVQAQTLADIKSGVLNQPLATVSPPSGQTFSVMWHKCG